jgi:hypothetical protein
MTTAATAVRLLVQLDLVVRCERGEQRVSARHAWCGTEVHTATSDPAGLRTASVDVVDWQRELAAVCRVDASSTSPPPAPHLEIPWDLVVGTGAALRRHRPDLYDVLVARADGWVRIGGRPLGPAATHDQVQRVHHGVVGRLRCTGTAPASRRVGLVSWLLYADGWRALTPYADPTNGGRAMVRLEPRSPGDLAHDVACWAVAR